jgi:hypothetical protein
MVSFLELLYSCPCKAVIQFSFHQTTMTMVNGMFSFLVRKVELFFQLRYVGINFRGDPRGPSAAIRFPNRIACFPHQSDRSRPSKKLVHLSETLRVPSIASYSRSTPKENPTPDKFSLSPKRLREIVISTATTYATDGYLVDLCFEMPPGVIAQALARGKCQTRRDRRWTGNFLIG